MLREIANQRAAIVLPALLVTQCIDLQDGVAGHPQRLQDLPATGDHLGVRQRLGRADQLDVDLVELPIPSLLRSLVAEHRTGAEHLLRQGLGQAVGHQRPANAGRRLRAQRDRIAASILEAVHFLGHHVGGLAQGAREHTGVLENRGAPLVEAIERGDPSGGIDHVLMPALVLADQVMGAARRLKFVWHAETN